MMTQEQEIFMQEMRLLIYSLEACIFAALAPEPSKEDIIREMQQDRLANPYNEPHKPKLRRHDEIVAQLKFKYATAMRKAKDELGY